MTLSENVEDLKQEYHIDAKCAKKYLAHVARMRTFYDEVLEEVPEENRPVSRSLRTFEKLMAGTTDMLTATINRMLHIGARDMFDGKGIANEITVVPCFSERMTFPKGPDINFRYDKFMPLLYSMIGAIEKKNEHNAASHENLESWAFALTFEMGVLQEKWPFFFDKKRRSYTISDVIDSCIKENPFAELFKNKETKEHLKSKASAIQYSAMSVLFGRSDDEIAANAESELEAASGKLTNLAAYEFYPTRGEIEFLHNFWEKFKVAETKGTLDAPGLKKRIALDYVLSNALGADTTVEKGIFDALLEEAKTEADAKKVTKKNSFFDYVVSGMEENKQFMEAMLK